jgi:hypothetical protein
MTIRTAAESKTHNIELMGHELGSQYAELWQEVAMIYERWGIYVQLYGSKPERVHLLNKVAGFTFRIIQDDLWDAMLLHIARMTDPPVSMGRNANLTLQNLPDLVDDGETKAAVTQAVEEVMALSEFCREKRNKYIAHRDLNIALNRSAVTLPNGSRTQIREVLKAITKALNIVEKYYKDGQSVFDIAPLGDDALGLLRALDDGHKLHLQRRDRLRLGKPTEDDFNLQHI